MNVDVLDVDGSGKSFERVVVKTVQRGHQAQVFRNALRDALGERMILHRQRDVTGEQFQSVEFTVFVKRVAGTAAEGDHSSETASGAQRSETLEQFRRDVAIGT